jgi:hypothetical protein
LLDGEVGTVLLRVGEVVIDISPKCLFICFLKLFLRTRAFVLGHVRIDLDYTLLVDFGRAQTVGNLT